MALFGWLSLIVNSGEIDGIELQYHAIESLLLLCYSVVMMYTYVHNFVMFGDTHKVLSLQPLLSLLVVGNYLCFIKYLILELDIEWTCLASIYTRFL